MSDTNHLLYLVNAENITVATMTFVCLFICLVVYFDGSSFISSISSTHRIGIFINDFVLLWSNSLDSLSFSPNRLTTKMFQFRQNWQHTHNSHKSVWHNRKVGQIKLIFHQTERLTGQYAYLGCDLSVDFVVVVFLCVVCVNVTFNGLHNKFDPFHSVRPSQISGRLYRIICNSIFKIVSMLTLRSLPLCTVQYSRCAYDVNSRCEQFKSIFGILSLAHTPLSKLVSRCASVNDRHWCVYAWWIL